MSVLPAVTGRELVTGLGKLGFEVVRVRGSHHSVEPVPITFGALQQNVILNGLSASSECPIGSTSSARSPP